MAAPGHTTSQARGTHWAETPANIEPQRGGSLFGIFSFLPS